MSVGFEDAATSNTRHGPLRPARSMRSSAFPMRPQSQAIATSAYQRAETVPASWPCGV